MHKPQKDKKPLFTISGKKLVTPDEAVSFLNSVEEWEPMHVKLMHVVIAKAGTEKAANMLFGLKRRLPKSVFGKVRRHLHTSPKNKKHSSFFCIGKKTIESPDEVVSFLNSVEEWEPVHVKLMHHILDVLGDLEGYMLLKNIDRRLPHSIHSRVKKYTEKAIVLAFQVAKKHVA